MTHIIHSAIIASNSDLPPASPDLLSAAQALSPEGRPFIDGRYCDPVDCGVVDKTTPITGQKFAQVASCTRSDVDRAVHAARVAFDDGRWSGLPPAQRKKLLLTFADQIEKHADELSLLDAIDMGKPFEAARSVDVNSCLTAIRWNAELVDKVYGEVAPTAGLDIVIREPIGVVGIIVPWNYPLMLAGWKFSAALAAGNCVILKPSELSPFSALRLGALAAAAGIPAGVFNVLPGCGAEIGAAMGSHAGINCIAFTGSTQIGKEFFRYSADSTIKHISLECGGKNPCIVAADADLKLAATRIASATFYNAGQSCNAPGRVLVHSSVAAEFTEMIAREAVAYSPTHPLLRGAKVGSLGSLEHLKRIAAKVDRAISDGAHVVCGGESLFSKSGGAYFAPTVITGVNEHMQLAQEEIFGPVLPIEEFEDLDIAIKSANNVPFGLWAGVWTSSLANAHKCIRRLQAGTVAVNNVFGGDITTPFGGYKESGVGRDRSIHGFLKYTQLKHVHFSI